MKRIACALLCAALIIGLLLLRPCVTVYMQAQFSEELEEKRSREIKDAKRKAEELLPLTERPEEHPKRLEDFLREPADQPCSGKP